MSDKRCPNERELLSFVDADLSPEQLVRVEKHLELCSSCAKQVLALSELLADVAAPLSSEPLDVALHRAGVMERLDSSLPVARRPAWLAWGSGLSVAAAALLLFVKLQSPGPVRAVEVSELVARGGVAEPSLSRDVGLKLYTWERSVPIPPDAGYVIARSAALTAGLRNLATEPVYLLLFALDSKQAVHWIAPEYTQPASDPEAALIEPSLAEQRLPTMAVFDDLAPGPLRVVALISREPLHVSSIESLPPAELGSQQLSKRFPRADVREFLLGVEAK